MYIEEGKVYAATACVCVSSCAHKKDCRLPIKKKNNKKKNRSICQVLR